MMNQFSRVQLLLGHGIEKIGLILGRILSPFQQIAAGGVIIFDAGVVSGDDAVIIQLAHALHQLVEFQKAVAVNAGVGGRAAFICPHELINHTCAEAIREIEHISLQQPLRLLPVGFDKAVSGNSGKAADHIGVQQGPTCEIASHQSFCSLGAAEGSKAVSCW